MSQSTVSSKAQSRHIKVLIFATFVAGLCSIVYELLIATTGSYFLGDSIRQFSLVIGFYMAFMGVGSYFSRMVPEKHLLSLFVIFEIILGLVGGLSVPFLYLSFAYFDLFQFSIILVTSIVGLLIGLEIPLLSRLMSAHYELKENISTILSLDYFGALLATLLFPFLLLPMMGVFKTSLFFGLINMSIGFTVVYYFSDVLKVEKKKTLYGFSIAALLMLGATFFFSKQLLGLWTNELYEDRVILAKETPYQQIVMTKQNEDIRFFLNGNLQFSSLDEYRYHESIVHIPMIDCDCKNILLLGGGDGLAIRELLKYPDVETITLVDLDPNVTQISKTNPHIQSLNQHALDDPKVTVINMDAFLYLRKVEELFDLVIIDLPDPNNTSLARLYSREFYWSIRSVLSEKGRFITQATSPYYAKKAFWTIHSTIQAAGFQSVVPFHISVPSFGEWGFIIGSQAQFPADVNEMSFDRLSRLETKYIDQHSIARALSFEKDMVLKMPQVSTLDSPVVLDYYLAGWKYWR